ncbi:MAG: FAD-dependent oxidoreductase [Bacilli bacterium]|nr:FAD-dependent oxidoreductase [Bacilli bacterium]
MKLIVVGAGWAGVAAAYEGARCGFDVTLIERTDMLLGTGLVGGIMRNNGRFTALEEIRAMGVHDLVNVIDQNCLHKNIDFPGHKHASLYDVNKIERAIKTLLCQSNVTIQYQTRINNVNLEDTRIKSVVSDCGETYEGDVFIDTTGTFGPMNFCSKYGNGCSMCIMRCPSFKGRVSVTGLCGIEEMQAKKKDGSIGAMSGSCKLNKDSLNKEIISRLNKEGVAIIPLPKEFIEDHLDIKACQQYALEEYKNNLILLDTGHAKLMTPFYPLEKLRQIPGFENARYIDPYTGGNGNSMRFFAIAPHENNLKVKGIENLLCAGEKAGMVGHTEAIITGILAGYNAKRIINRKALLSFSRETLVGEAIAFTNEQLQTEEGLSKKYTVSGSVLFNRLLECNLYTTDIEEIKKKIKKLDYKL